MHNPKQMLEIRFPSGAAILLNFAKAAKLVAARIPGVAAANYMARPSTLLRDIFRVPLVEVYSHRDAERGGIPLTHQDHVTWAEVTAHPLGTAPIPFTLHLGGVQERVQEQPLHLSPEVFQDLDATLASASNSYLRGRPAESMRTLAALSEALVNLTAQAKQAEPAPADGWGHTSENASVEDLLREGAAAEEGTDNHEQVIRQLLGEDNAKGAIEMLLGAVKAQGALIGQLQLGRIEDLKRLHALGEWLRSEAAINPSVEGLQQVVMTFALQLSRIGIAPKCPHCPGNDMPGL